MTNAERHRKAGELSQTIIFALAINDGENLGGAARIKAAESPSPVAMKTASAVAQLVDGIGVNNRLPVWRKTSGAWRVKLSRGTGQRAMTTRASHRQLKAKLSAGVRTV